MDFAKANEVDPGGTALAPDVVVLAEVDEPWPKPVGKHPALMELVREAQAWPENIRLLAAVPSSDAPRRVIAFRRAPGGATRSERPMCVDPVTAFTEVLSDPEPELVDAATGVTSLLVCTQGSHDVCCGTDGVALAEWVEEHLDVEVFRVSHTGGHRFAPTAMTLPDGRMWAYLNESSVIEVVQTRSDAASVVGQCRGWWGASTGPTQVAERAVFAVKGFRLDSMDRSITVDEETPERVVVAVDGEDYEVVVEAGREVPTIACEEPGGVPVKPGREWRVVSGPTVR